MDYQSFQNFINKHDFDESELKLLDDIMKSCIIPQSRQKIKRKLYSFRLNESDMTKLKSIAQTQGIPYQTLVGSIIHRYVIDNYDKNIG